MNPLEKVIAPEGQNLLSQKELYCIARHLFSFHSNAIKKEIADYARPCLKCEYALSGTCTDNPLAFDPMPAFTKLSDLTGVRFSMCANADFEEIEDRPGNDRVHP